MGTPEENGRVRVKQRKKKGKGSSKELWSGGSKSAGELVAREKKIGTNIGRVRESPISGNVGEWGGRPSTGQWRKKQAGGRIQANARRDLKYQDGETVGGVRREMKGKKAIQWGKKRTPPLSEHAKSIVPDNGTCFAPGSGGGGRNGGILRYVKIEGPTNFINPKGNQERRKQQNRVTWHQNVAVPIGNEILKGRTSTFESAPEAEK